MRVVIALPLPLSIVLCLVLVATVSGFSLDDEVRITDTSVRWATPIIAIDAEGSTHLVYGVSPNQSLMYRKVDQDGRTTFGPVRISAEVVSAGHGSGIKIDSEGRVHVVFIGQYENDTSSNVFYCLLDDEGTVLVRPRKVTNSTNSSNPTNIDIDGNGNAFIVWVEQSNPERIYWSNILSDGSTTGPRVMVSGKMDPGEEVYRPTIAIGPDGVSHVFWQQRSDHDSRWALFISNVSPEGQVIAGPVELFPDRDMQRSNIEVTMDDSLGIHAVYLEESSEEVSVIYALFGEDGEVMETVTVVEAGTDGIPWADFDLTPHGDKVIVYMERNGTGDESWRIGMRILSPGNDASLSFDITGYEFFFSVPDCVCGSDGAAVFFVRDRDVFQRTVDTSVVNYPPLSVLTYEPASPAVGEWVTFSGAGSEDPDDGDRVAEFLFDWGDGSGSDWRTSPEADHRFIEAGTYTITLYVRDGHGLQSENPASVTLVIEEPDIVTSDDSWLLIAIIVALVISILTAVLLTRYRE